MVRNRHIENAHVSLVPHVPFVQFFHAPVFIHFLYILPEFLYVITSKYDYKYLLFPLCLYTEVA